MTPAPNTSCCDACKERSGAGRSFKTWCKNPMCGCHQPTQCCESGLKKAGAGTVPCFDHQSSHSKCKCLKKPQMGLPQHHPDCELGHSKGDEGCGCRAGLKCAAHSGYLKGESWEAEFDKKFGENGIQIHASASAVKAFISKLLSEREEEAVRQHDAQWHPIENGKLKDMHVYKEGLAAGAEAERKYVLKTIDLYSLAPSSGLTWLKEFLTRKATSIGASLTHQ